MGMVENPATHLFYPCPQKTPDKKLESLQFSLYDDESEVRLRVHIPCLVFDKFNLAASLALLIPM